MTEREQPQSIAAVYEDVIGGGNPIVALLRRYVPGRSLVFGVALGMAAAHQLLALVPPYLLGVTIDTFFAERSEPLSIWVLPQSWIPATTRGQFVFVAGLFGGTAVLTASTLVVRFVAFRWFQQSVIHDLRLDAYNAVQRLDMAFFDAEETGNVMSILNDDVNQLRDVLGDGIRQSVESATVLLGVIAVMGSLHWQLTLFVSSFVPLMLGLVVGYRRAVEPRYDARREAVGDVNAHVQNAIDGIETVKAFGNERRERARLRTRSRSFWRADWRAAKLSAVFFASRSLVVETVSLAIVVVGGWWVLFGPPFAFTAPLTTGTFVTFLFYGRTLVHESSTLGDIVDTYADATASAKRIFGLVRYPVSITEPNDAVPLESVDGHVSYRDVTFTYPNADEPVLRDLTSTIPAGDFVGIVGTTGAGKSTLLKLLLRFDDPDDGTITIDGTDISTIARESLRSAIGYVSQDPVLFGGTIRETIAYGDPTASEERIIDAAKRANAHSFIEELPDSYDTEIGERGVKLSGGQRQRLAIARAILPNPAILVFDEATSDVDNRTETAIQRGLRDVIADRTTIMITHRLSTVRDADRILVLENGRIAESGDHETLVSADGTYASLWAHHEGDRDAVTEATASGE